MALKKVEKKKPQLKVLESKFAFSEDEIARMGREYSEISAHIKSLEAKKKDLADKIKQGAEVYGVKDDKGSFCYESNTHYLSKVAKKSVSIDQEKAIATLEEMGLEDLIHEEVVRTVDESLLEEAVLEKRISIEDVEGFTNVKTSYSVLVKEKEECPEVKQSNLLVARRKK